MGRGEQSLSYRWLYAIQRESDLNVETRAVAAALFARMNRDGGNCCPGVDTIAHDSGVGRSTAKRRLRTLEERGWLEIELRGGIAVKTPTGTKYTNRYLPLIPVVKRRPDGSVETPQLTKLTVQNGRPDGSHGLADSSEGAADGSPVNHNHDSKNTPVGTPQKRSSKRSDTFRVLGFELDGDDQERAELEAAQLRDLVAVHERLNGVDDDIPF